MSWQQHRDRDILAGASPRTSRDEAAVMAEVSKRIKRLIREYAAAAHEEELRRALLPLADAFKQWERREIDSFVLEDLIHHFHQGAARDVYLRYASNRPEPAVAHAIVAGILDRSAVPAEILGILLNYWSTTEVHRKDREAGLA